ncbi:LuxR C-terminal-related transcriptional regulator [Labrys neptuniae]
MLKPRYAGNIILVSSNKLLRDCIDIVLSADVPDYKVQLFSNVDEWCRVSSLYTHVRLLILCENGGVDESRALISARDCDPTIPVLVLSNSDDAASIIQAIDLGARGYVSCARDVGDLVQAVRRLINGETFVPAEAERAEPARKSMTQRQLSIIAAIRLGKTNAEIGRELGIGESTVKVHVRKIMRQLQVTNRTAIAHRSRDILLTGDYPIPGCDTRSKITPADFDLKTLEPAGRPPSA